MIPARISLLTIGASSVPTLRAFYQSLGWEETSISSDEYVVFRTAGVLLSIFPIAEVLNESGLDFTAASLPYKGITISLNVEEASEVDSVIDGIRGKGGKIVKEPHDAVWGGRIGYFLDPENNLWEVAWNPTAVFNEYGAMTSF